MSLSMTTHIGHDEATRKPTNEMKFLIRPILKAACENFKIAVISHLKLAFWKYKLSLFLKAKLFREREFRLKLLKTKLPAFSSEEESVTGLGSGEVGNKSTSDIS